MNIIELGTASVLTLGTSGVNSEQTGKPRKAK